MQYIVMDLEWNTAYSKKLGGFINEIIEIGALALDEQLQETKTFSVIIRSQVSKRLQSRVKSLTHLTNADISHGVTFREAVERFTAWLGDEDNTFLTWGDGDIRTLVKNCACFLELPEIPFLHHYVDLQKYCQSFTDAANSGQQLGLSAAAVKLGIDPDVYPHHRALDDSRLAAACLLRVFDQKRLSQAAHRCDKPFYERLSFHPYYISDINSPLVDADAFRCVCDVCGGKVKKEKNWKYSNHAFRAVFYCQPCDRRFRVSIQYKQLYDRLDVRKTYTEIKNTPESIPVKAEKSEA